MATHRSRRSPGKNRKQTAPDPPIQGVALQPIGVVERELTRPDGTKLTVKVPVYPPFQLPERKVAKSEARSTNAKKKAS